jgi:Tfp pilus assembly protein PilF
VPVWRYFTDRTTTSTRPEYNTRIYRPLRNLALRGLWRLSDVAPHHRTWFFHGANLLLYVLGGWLVLALALLLGQEVRAAALAAGLWLLLPVHAEDVLYASAFGDLLSMVLQVGGLCYVVRALEPARPRVRTQAVIAILLFSLSVFVKEMAITSVLIVPAYLWSEHRDALRARRRPVFLLVVGHGLVAVAYLVLRTALLGRVSQSDATGAALLRAIVHLPWLTLLNMRVALQPLGHAPDYGADLRGIFGTIAGAIGFFVLVALAWRPRRGLRFGALVFFLALLPVLQLLPMWTLLADRFLLVPSVGLALAAGALVEGRRRIALVVCAALAVVYGGSVLIERGRFRDDGRFWAWAVETVPDAGLSQHNLGLIMLKRGDPQRAFVHLDRAFSLGRRHPLLFLHLASALEGLGRYREAEAAAKTAVAADPELGGGWAQLASLQRRRGDLAAAEQSLRSAMEHHCAEEQVLQQRAALRLAQGRPDEALADYHRVVTLLPENQPAWATLGEAALLLGRREEARQAASRCGAVPRCAELRAQLLAISPVPAAR